MGNGTEGYIIMNMEKNLKKDVGYVIFTSIV